MTLSELLLTATRQSQLTAALANLGVPAPLETCIAEAEADVTRYATGYTLAGAARNGFVRALALFKAFSLCGPVPADIQRQYDEAIAELKAIAAGQRPNLEQTAAAPSSRGSWGSREKVL